MTMRDKLAQIICSGCGMRDDCADKDEDAVDMCNRDETVDKILDATCGKYVAFEVGRDAGREEVVGYANKFLEIAERSDYGRVQTRKLLDEWIEKWEGKLKEWWTKEDSQ